MDFDYLHLYLDYSGAFNELFGFVQAVSEQSSNSDVKRIFVHFLEFKGKLDKKYFGVGEV